MVMCTRNIRFLRKGDKGDKGDRGRLPVPYGEYVAGTAYTATDLIAPYVLCEGQYYVMNKTTTWQQSSRTPKQDYAQYGSNATWILLEKYKAIFVELLMANLGLIGKAVFYQQYMFSQYGKIGSTEVSTEGSYAVPVDAGGNFEPNFIVNFLTGEMRCNRGEFAGGLRIPFKALSQAGLNYMYRESTSKPGTGGDFYYYHYQLLATSARYVDLSEHIVYYDQCIVLHIPNAASLDGCRFAFSFPYRPMGYDLGGALNISVATGGQIYSPAIQLEQDYAKEWPNVTYRRISNGGLVEIVIQIKDGHPLVHITSGDVPDLYGKNYAPWSQ